MAQMSFRRSGTFCPTSLPLFQGSCLVDTHSKLSMIASFEEFRGAVL